MEGYELEQTNLQGKRRKGYEKFDEKMDAYDI